jgi:hypothetical protein
MRPAAAGQVRPNGRKEANMKTATALALIAIGAILAFAITKQPSFFNLHIAGWVLMLTGVVGLVVPRRRYGWLRTRTVKHRGQAEQAVTVEEVAVEPRFSALLAPGGIDTRSVVEPAVDDPPISPR